MSDLAAFLLARIAEDEAAIGRHVAGVARENRTLWQPRWSVTRLIAECEAKRRIVDLWREAAEGLDEDDVAFTMSMSEYPSGVLTALSATLRYLALPYADHPDYRPEWKP